MAIFRSIWFCGSVNVSQARLTFRQAVTNVFIAATGWSAASLVESQAGVRSSVVRDAMTEVSLSIYDSPIYVRTRRGRKSRAPNWPVY